MGLVGLAFLGVVLGAAGTEFLRVKRPDIIEKIEDSAKRFVDSVYPTKSDDEKTQKK
ncbi:MAG: hypothetical protein HQ579_00695 [Candidatus Omnitrophica bacterium]|nr:hypothetical protein [Candidatus Omnitrophota bacterium]